MKKVLYILLGIAALLTSCISNENEFENTPQLISFQPVIHSTQTRAKANEFATTLTFGAYAWLGTTDVAIKDNTYINNKEVRYNGTSWAFTSPCYWPSMGYLDFFCYTPYSATSPQPRVTVDEDYRKNTLEYTDITANASTPDYMYSAKTINQNQQTTVGGQGVSVIFNHALAKVKVTFRMNMVDDGQDQTWSVDLKQFTITNITNKGGVVMTLEEQKIGWMKPKQAVWKEALNAKEDWNLLPQSKPDRHLSTTKSVLLKETMVIPQVLEDAMKLTIIYDLNTTKNNNTNTEEKSIDIPLNSIKGSDGRIMRWEMNKIISYNVVVNPPSSRKPLQFSPTVDVWLNNESSVEVNPK